MRAWISLLLGVALLLTIPACGQKRDPRQEKGFNAAEETDPTKIERPSLNPPPPNSPATPAPSPAGK